MHLVSGFDSVSSASEMKFEPSVNKIRVLIIDEHGAVRRALAARLDSYCEVEVVATASNFTEGLEQACLHQPDVVLFELKSKGIRRPEQIEEMIGTLTDHPAGIIVLTAYADDDEREAAMKAGARRYLVKHIDSSQLVAEIKAVANEETNQLG